MLEGDRQEPCGPTGATGPTGPGPVSSDSESSFSPASDQGPTGPTGPESSTQPVAEARAATYPGRSNGTSTAYGRDFAAFARWCEDRGFESLPASRETVVSYLVELLGEGRRVRGVTRVNTGINSTHVDAGLEKPWPSKKALERDLEARVPEAFTQDSEESQPDREAVVRAEERQGFVRVLRRIGAQDPSLEVICCLAGDVEQGIHLGDLDRLLVLDEVFRGETQTTCVLCAGAVSRGRRATDSECRAHRCP